MDKKSKMMLDRTQRRADKAQVRLRYEEACGSDADCAEKGRKKGMKNPENPFREKTR